MTDTHHNDEAKRFPWLMFSLLVLFVAYPLSTGPMFWLDIHGYVSGEAACEVMDTFYAPIEWVTDSSETLQNLYYRYLSLFAPVG
ncbi:MAG: hypothetical protein KDA86_25930 [Planctomycetaceae bacterium]|nr:hypothetical protein [Planctomycetaceae bacterium]